MRHAANERRTQVIVCASILLALAAAVCSLLLGWRYLPGLLGEWTGFMAGVLTSPFFMEASFAVIGLTIVLCVNHWRQKRSGDELMYLELAEESAILPDHEAWSLSCEPIEREMPPLLVQAEGALAIGDHEAAALFLAAMPEHELRQPEVLAVRLELARATGKSELAARLEREITLSARC